MVDDLIERLQSAKTKVEIACALDAISYAKRPVSLDPLIVSYAGDSRWLVRHAAIGALGACPDPQTERLLLDIGRGTQDESDLVYVNVSLGSVGSRECLGYLESMARHGKEDVATSALHALTVLGSSKQLPCFIAALHDKRWALKWYAMIAIEKHGDSSAVEPVLARVKRILGRKRAIEQGDRSELTAGLAFLWAHRSADPRASTFFADYLPARRHRLFEDEVKALDGMMSPA